MSDWLLGETPLRSGLIETLQLERQIGSATTDVESASTTLLWSVEHLRFT